MGTKIITIQSDKCNVMSGNRQPMRGSLSATIGDKSITGINGETFFQSDLAQNFSIVKPYICVVDEDGDPSVSMVGTVLSLQSETEGQLAFPSPKDIDELPYEAIVDRPSKVTVHLVGGSRAILFNPDDGTITTIVADTVLIAPPPYLVTAEGGNVMLELEYAGL